MSGFPCSIYLVLFLLPLTAGRAASLELVPGAESPCVFFGPARQIPFTLRNRGNQEFIGAIRARVFQTSSSTAVPVGDSPARTLRVLPRQTVLEVAAVDFPAVRAETRFLLQWLEQSNQVLGSTEVWVYPTNLLAELGRLEKDEPIGVFDPLNQLKPLLRRTQAEFTDLEYGEMEEFSGRLVILGPFSSLEQVPKELADKIRAWGKRGVAVVWLQPPQPKTDGLKPSFYAVPKKRVATVVVQPSLVADLTENPQAQLNLVTLCKLALHPHAPELPE